MKYLLSVFVLIFVAVPASVFAICSDTGATVVYVNGVKNSQKDADNSKYRLQLNFQKKFNDTSVKFITGYNPSHLAGVGDFAQSAAQMLDGSISDHDLNTILTQIEPYVTTRKILLVGHSQGTFYTNSLYQYLINHAVPKESIAVYNVATPAYEVAGNGWHLTSSNDAAIRAVTQLAQKLQILLPLPANIDIPIYPDDTESDYSGHDFIRAYIAGASSQIVSGVSQALNNLTVKTNTETSETCFTAPQLTVGDKLQDIAFVPFDFVANIGVLAFSAIGKRADQTATVLAKGIFSFANTLASVFNTSSKGQAGAVAEILNPNDSVEKSITQDEERHTSADMIFTLEQPEQEINVSEIAAETSETSETLEKDIATAQTTVSDNTVNNTLQKEIIPNIQPATLLPYPGFGGGGDATQKTNTVAENIDTTPPNAPIITSPENFSGVFSTTTLSFTGTSEASATVEFAYAPSGTTTVATTTANADGNGGWSFSNMLFGQGTTTVNIYAKDQAENRSTATTIAVKVDTRPSSPSISSPSNLTLAFATTTITFSGTASSTNVISNSFNNATTTADGTNNWTLTLASLPEGTTTVQFAATDSFSLSSASTTVDVAIDTVSPSPSALTILECQYSLVTGSCFSGGNTVHLSWTSTSTDIAYHSIVKDGIVAATTTSASTTFTFSANGTYSISIVAYDHAGNAATSSAQSVETYESPVVINEIAWAGTKSASSDEWIELYNRGTQVINLSNVFLSSEDGTPYFHLSGSISSGEYYLIERTSSTTTSVSSDLVTAFSGIGSGSGLGNEGEVLRLIHDLGGQASTTLDSTPSLSSCGGGWCAGEASTSPVSMERKNPDVSGATASNWSSNNTYTKNGTDANSNTIYGTPRARNSINTLSIGYYCPSYSSTYVENGYYIPSSGYSCVYLSPTFSGNRYGDLYKGVIGNATIINGHFLSTSATSTQSDDTLPSPSQGDTYFTAIYQIQNDPDVAAFRSYFMTGASNPPHLNYGTLNWKYGVAP